MSFDTLNKEQLADVAAFFLKEVVAADPVKGPSKKELVAALAAGEDPVTWEQYKTIYNAGATPAVGATNAFEGNAEEAIVRDDHGPAPASAEEIADKRDEDEPVVVVVSNDVSADEVVIVESDDDEDDDVEEEMLIKMGRRNGTYETHGLRFTKGHPFKSVPVSVGESILEKEEGFFVASPSEIKDYYN